jgi:hypothetical protein
LEHKNALDEEPAIERTGAGLDCGCRAKRQRLLNILLWFVLLYGILSLRALPGDYSHRLCGPWGCLPPFQALAAVHGAWALVVATAVAWFLRTQSPRRLRRAGIVLACLGAGGPAVLVGHDLSTWPLKASDSAGAFLPQRLLCSVVMTTDLPLVPITIAGTAIWYVGLKKNIYS